MRNIVPYEKGDFLSAQILRAARSVYQCLGPGRSETYYREAFVNELRRLNFDVQQRFPVDVWQNCELAELYFLDLLVEWQAVVEIEASDRPFTDYDRNQMVEYLYTSSTLLGLRLHFGWHGLAFDRIYAAPPHRRAV